MQSLSAKIKLKIYKRNYNIAHPYSSLSEEQKERRRATRRRCYAKKKKSDPEYLEKERARNRANNLKRREKLLKLHGKSFLETTILNEEINEKFKFCL